jgi:hypothetical protein
MWVLFGNAVVSCEGGTERLMPHIIPDTYADHMAGSLYVDDWEEEHARLGVVQHYPVRTHLSRHQQSKQGRTEQCQR